MILNRIKERGLRSKIDKELENNRVLSNNKVESILILLDKNINNSICKTLVSELEFDESKLTKIVFCDKLINEDETLGIEMSKKQFSWLGKIKNKKVNNLVNFKFDLLINLTRGNLYLDYLTVLSKSGFKVGLSNSDIRFYDFMISTDLDNITVFNRELKKYLKILNKI